MDDKDLQELDEQELQELLKSVPPEERAAAWEKYVRDQVNHLLDIFLPESVFGNVAVRYDYPVKGVDSKTGKKIFDEKATGVTMMLMFDFAAPIEFYGEAEPKEKSE